MNFLLICVAFTIVPTETLTFTHEQQARDAVAERMTSGTLLLSKGDCLAVKVYSLSKYTHVAAVVVEDKKIYVYDSMNGVGVRRQLLVDYLKSEIPDKIYLLKPKKPFSKKRTGLFVKYLNDQLGTPYAIAHHLTGKRGKGVHCSEYLTDALMACNLIDAQKPSRVSPGSLAEGVVNSGLYEAGCRLQIVKPLVEKTEGSNRCEQLWIDTKICTLSFYYKVRRMFFCR